MEQLKVTPTTPNVLRARPAAGQFKVCPLCGALNVIENCECFVCRWQGEFDCQEAMVRMKVHEIIASCPELLGVISMMQLPRRRNWLERTWANLVDRFRRVDLRV
ncbi:MAG: hypothetical protein R2688_09750 [Fimbriimonadaceae bacterium]